MPWCPCTADSSGVFLVYAAILLVGGTAVVLASQDLDSARDRERSTGIARERVIQLRKSVQRPGDGRARLPPHRGAIVPHALRPRTRNGGATADERLSSAPTARPARGGPPPSLGALGDRGRPTGDRPPEDAGRGRGGSRGRHRDGQGEVRHPAQARVARLDRNAAALNAQANLEVDDLRDRLNSSFAVVLGVVLLWTFVAAWLVRRWITVPLDNLGRTVRAARTGALDATISTQGPADIARLGAAVEDMRLQLVTARLEAIHSREATEQSASVVLTLRSQLETEIGELPDGWTVAAQLRPAEGLVAGDCYDVMRVDEHRFHVVLVDISGHGAVSGVLALRCKELLRAALRNGLEPGPAIEFASAQLDDLGNEVFLSAFVATIALDSGAIAFANAGHPLACSATTRSAAS